MYVPLGVRVAIPNMARGCPFTCSFCSQWKFWRDYRVRDPKKVADEMLKSMEEQEKQALAAARTAYGDACVDVLSKRIKELGQFQIDLMKELADQVQKDAETK